MHRVSFIVFILLACASSYAQQLSVDALVREAFVSNALSDRFKAYRVLAFLREKRPEAFFELGIQEHLESYFRLSSIKQFEMECENLSSNKNYKIRDRVLYTCGRLLFESFSLQSAQKLLSQISAKSELAVQGSIYLASLQMGDGDGEKCLKTLSPALLKKIKNQNTKDLFFLTRARCLVEVSQIEQSVLQYQQITSGSPYYYDALEETAWAQFRIRHLESARTLLDVLITTHETGIQEGGGVTAPTYFRARYLQAYIELIEKNSKKAEQMFRSLRDSILKYSESNHYNEEKVKKISNLIIEQNGKWLDVKAMPKEIKDYLIFVRGWADNRMRKRIDRSIDYQFSITREIDRLTTYPNSEFDSYLGQLKLLSTENSKLLTSELMKASRSAERALRVIKIKSELGRIEITWAERAQGVRGIGELIESYQKEVDEVEDFF